MNNVHCLHIVPGVHVLTQATSIPFTVEEYPDLFAPVIALSVLVGVLLFIVIGLLIVIGALVVKGKKSKKFEEGTHKYTSNVEFVSEHTIPSPRTLYVQ